MILIQYAHETLLDILHITWMLHPTEAPKRTANDTILLLENKIWRAKFPSKNLIHKILNSEIVYYMRFLLKRKEDHNERFLSYLWKYYQNLLQQGLLFLLALLFGCNNTADNNQTIANTQK